MDVTLNQLGKPPAIHYHRLNIAYHMCVSIHYMIARKTLPVTVVQPFKPSRSIKASFYIPENRLNFSTTKGFRMTMKLVYQYMAIFFNFSLTLNHFHPLQVENCDSNSRLVVDEDDNGKLRLERVYYYYIRKRRYVTE